MGWVIRYALCILMLINISCACRGQNRNITAATTSKFLNKDADTTLYAKTDSITIVGGIRDTLIFSKGEFNAVVNDFPELHSSYPTDPDASYYKRRIARHFIENGVKKELSFSSEAGQDEYCILYSYFLKKRNGEKKISGRRDTLIQIYNDINTVFDRLMNGGTYFGHQYGGRIGAYAEYSIYLFCSQDSQDIFFKAYSIAAQKRLFIKSLRQFITDEINNDNNNGLSDIDKRIKIHEITKVIDHLSTLISEYFYLERAQEFRYSKYEY